MADYTKKLGNIAFAIILIAITCLSASILPAFADEGKKPEIVVDYFYINPCGSCDEEGKFLDQFNKLFGTEDENIEVKLRMYNTFRSENAAKLQQYFDKYKIPREKQDTPALFIGDTYLIGTSEIDKNLKSEFIRITQSIEQPGAAEGPEKEAYSLDRPADGFKITGNISDGSVFVYFYVTSCDECKKVGEILKELGSEAAVHIDGRQIRSRISPLKYNIAEEGNLTLVKQYFKYYNVPDEMQQVPIIFIGSTYFSGEKEIKEGLAKAVSDGQGFSTALLSLDGSKPDTDMESLSGYRVMGVFITGLVNGLNPCSLSMLLFFLSLLVVKNVNVLKAGFAFIAGKFIVFTLLGTLLFNLFLKSDIDWFQTVSKIVLIAASAVFIILNLHDFLAARSERYNKITLQLPEGLRRYNHHLIKKISALVDEKVFLPVCFILGMFIAAGEFLCTGQVYLATIVYVLQNSPVFNARAMFYFVFYGAAFILPLVLLTIFIYKGKEIFHVSEALRSKMPVIKLVNAIVFAIFGAIVLFSL